MNILTEKDGPGDLTIQVLGEFINNDNSNDSDEWALKNGYISIVPIQHDLTNYSVLKDLQNWNF